MLILMIVLGFIFKIFCNIFHISVVKILGFAFCNCSCFGFSKTKFMIAGSYDFY